MALFDDKTKKYLIDIKKNNLNCYKFNDEFFGYITSNEEYNTYCSHLDSECIATDLTKKVNDFLAFRLFDYDPYTQIIYRVIFFILKIRSDFNIDIFARERCFVNVINYNLFTSIVGTDFLYGDEDFEIVLKEKIQCSKKIMNELVTILQIPTDDIQILSERYKLKYDHGEKASLIFDLLVNELIEMYHDEDFDFPEDLYSENLIQSNLIPDSLLHEMKDRLLERYYKQEAINEYKSKKETTENTESIAIADTKEKDESEKHYKCIVKTLEKYIEKGTSKSYRSIFESQKLKKGMMCLVFIKANKRELILFANTFGLSLDELKNVAKLKFGRLLKDIEITKAYFNSNKIEPFVNPIGLEKALNTVETEHLKKIISVNKGNKRENNIEL